MRMGRIRAALVPTGLLGLTAVAFSQGFGGFRGGFSSDAPESEFSANAEFHFLRMEYTDGSGGTGASGSVRAGAERQAGGGRIGRTPTSTSPKACSG